MCMVGGLTSDRWGIAEFEVDIPLEGLFYQLRLKAERELSGEVECDDIDNVSFYAKVVENLLVIRL